MKTEIKTMRDAMISRIHQKMKEDNNIFFLSADMGAPTLDALREEFADRFVNVGIAEQNLVNVSAGMALEGYTVYSFAIAPFLTMRAFEQIKNNVSLTAQLKTMNINLMGVGVGLSYDMGGPSHHGIEDIALMNTLPNMIIFSPSDWKITEKFVDFTTEIKKPKYIRLDGKPMPNIYTDNIQIDFNKGFYEWNKGERVCILSTGVMTHKALQIQKECNEKGINVGIIDVFVLKPLDHKSLYNLIKDYDSIITLEEGFVDKGGLDTIVSNILNKNKVHKNLIRLGFNDSYVLEIGDREYLHKINGMSKKDIIKIIEEVM